jgi:hypothetical protein
MLQKEQGVLGTTHKAYLHVALTSTPTNPVLLMLYLDDVKLPPTLKFSLACGLVS